MLPLHPAMQKDPGGEEQSKQASEVRMQMKEELRETRSQDGSAAVPFPAFDQLLESSLRL